MAGFAGGGERSSTRTRSRFAEQITAGNVPHEFSAKARILIIDDERDERGAAAAACSSARGSPAIQTTTDPARSAPTLYVEFRPDLILLDLHMPHLDGLAVMDELNQIAEATYLPILMLTGDVSPEARRDALSRGAKDFLHKPFSTDEVLLRIGTLLETRFLYLQIQSQNQMLEAKVRERTRELEGGADRDHRAAGQGGGVPRRQHRAAHRARRPDGGADRQADRAARRRRCR